MIRFTQFMRKGFEQSGFESAVGVADGQMGDNFKLTPPIADFTQISQNNSTRKETMKHMVKVMLCLAAVAGLAFGAFGV